MLGSNMDMPGIPGLPAATGFRQDLPTTSNLLRRTVFTASGTWIKSAGCTSINLIFVSRQDGAIVYGGSAALLTDASYYSSQAVTISQAASGSSSFGAIASMTNAATGSNAPSFSGQELFSTIGSNSGIGTVNAQIIVEEYA
jgi:hypothetical protein